MNIQEQYNQIQEGKGNKDFFMKNVKRIFPNFVNQYTSYNDAVNILKSKNFLFESTPTEAEDNLQASDFIEIFNNSMNPPKQSLTEAKSKNKKPKDLNKNAFDNKNLKNIDNVYGTQFLNGYYFEIKQTKNLSKTVEEVKEIVRKNLSKDVNFYVKNGQFGTDGVGYKEPEEIKEPKGKHKGSGYGDIDKKDLNENQYYDSDPTDGDRDFDKEQKILAYEWYDKGLELYKQGNIEQAEEYRQKALEYGSYLSWGDVELPPYNNSMNEYNEEGYDFQIGDTVKINPSLTTDPLNKQGETGEILEISDDIIKVQFSDGQIGEYVVYGDAILPTNGDLNENIQLYNFEIGQDLIAIKDFKLKMGPLSYITLRKGDKIHIDDINNNEIIITDIKNDMELYIDKSPSNRIEFYDFIKSFKPLNEDINEMEDDEDNEKWKNMSYEQREDILLQFCEDPDDAEKYISIEKFDDLPDWLSTNISRQLNENKKLNMTNKNIKPTLTEMVRRVLKENEEKQKPVKKGDVNSRLKTFQSESSIIAVESQIKFIKDEIERINEKVNAADQMDELQEFVDPTKIKSLKKEVALFEREKDKLEKVYERMTKGKKRVVTDTPTEEESTEVPEVDEIMKESMETIFANIKDKLDDMVDSGEAGSVEQAVNTYLKNHPEHEKYRNQIAGLTVR